MSNKRNSPVSDSSDSRPEVVLSLKTVHKMLPLVRRIVDDVLLQQKTIESINPEEERLDRARRHLEWPARQRRYQLKADREAAEAQLTNAGQELRDLGLSLLVPVLGQVGFPTLVNNRRAFFTWHPGEEGVTTWQYADETVPRPIPSSWLRELAPGGTPN